MLTNNGPGGELDRLDKKMQFENQKSQSEDATLKLTGKVDKIIPPVVPGECFKLQISIPCAEDLYREIRVPIQVDGNGPHGIPEQESEVEIVIRVRA